MAFCVWFLSLSIMCSRLPHIIHVLVLHSTPLCVCTICLFIHELMEIGLFLPFGYFALCYYICVQVFIWTHFQFILLHSQEWNCWVIQWFCLTYWVTAKLCSIAAVAFHIPVSNESTFQFLHILSTTYVFKIIVISVGVKWYLNVVLIFTMPNDAEHLFMCLLALCISSLEECLSPLPILKLGCLFVIKCRSPFIFWILVLTSYVTYKYFLLFCELAFHLSDSVLWYTEAFNFDEV